ncbi:MAG: hypothetical protein RMK20_16235 [Verrucomicrobiales bacterium]|nr:hypothetical protein [Verrucomicrobiales bacterium]
MWINLEQLMYFKRAAGRPRTLESIAELEALLEERRARPHTRFGDPP